LLPPAVESIAANGRIHAGIVFAVEIVAIPAEVIIGLTDVLQFARYEFQDDDVIEIADDRNIVGQYVFRVAEIDECGQDALTIRIRQVPLGVIQHLDQRLEFR
jgi:hypothetical protein